MITLSRRQALDAATLIRRLLELRGKRATLQPVQIVTGPTGLSLRAWTAQLALEYRELTPRPPGSALLPLKLLQTAAGRSHDEIAIEQLPGEPATLRWQDGAIPRTATAASACQQVEAFPSMPQRWLQSRARLIQVLQDASETTDRCSSRYALGCVQLRGSEGAIAATDGRQLLVQRGLELGFEETILVPATCGWRSLPVRESVEIGKTADHLVIRSGRWTVWLAIEKEARFPQIDDVIPSSRFAKTQLELARADRSFLSENLKRLPGGEFHDAPLTLDLNGRVALRAREEGESATVELVLTNSVKTGEDVRLAMNGRYLARAVSLGFEQLYLNDARAPILCQDERRQYVWAVLEPSASVAGGPNVASIYSPPGCPDRQPARRRPIARGQAVSLASA
jgi:hypothetical protein